MTSLDLTATTANLLFAAPAAPAAPEAGALETAAPAPAAGEAEPARSVTVDIEDAGADAGADADAARAADACMSEMSFSDLADSVVPSDSASQAFSPRNVCTDLKELQELKELEVHMTCRNFDTSEMSFSDLADSVVPSDSASQVFSPRSACRDLKELKELHMTCRNFDELHMTLCPADDAYQAWKGQCEREEAAAREQAKHDLLVQRLLREHAARQAGGDAADAKGDLGMRHLVQSVRNIERSVAQLHLHFDTNFQQGRGAQLRKPASAAIGATPDAPPSFQISTNVNAPNMNRQHATGGRGRGRRHANVG